MAQRGIFDSAARTETTNSSDFDDPNSLGLHIVIDVTGIADTPSIVPKIQGKDPVSGKYYDVLVGTAITDVTGTGTYVFKVGPGLEPSPGAAAGDYLPDIWRLRIEHADTDSITYSAAAVLAG